LAALDFLSGCQYRCPSGERWIEVPILRNGLTLKLIKPGKPTQNGDVESFNGKFRNECLNEYWFSTLAEARAIVPTWRRDCAGEALRAADVVRLSFTSWSLSP